MTEARKQRVFNQGHQPVNATVGDAWIPPDRSIKRVLSRGGSWENVHIDGRHPDEPPVPQDDEPQAQQESSDERQTEDNDAETGLSSGTDSPAQDAGDDGQTAGGAEPQQEDPGLTQPEGVRFDEPPPSEMRSDTTTSDRPAAPDRDEDRGIDGNGSPVV